MKTFITPKRGFTLIELVVTIGIIGILAALVYPSYAEYAVRARRADAMTALSAAAAAMERHHKRGNTYLNASLVPCAAPCVNVFTNQVPTEGGTAYYRLDLSNLGQSTYTITATPIGVQPPDSGPLTIDARGRKTWDGNPCWPTTRDCP